MRRSSSRLVLASVKIEVHSISTLTVIVRPIYIHFITDAIGRELVEIGKLQNPAAECTAKESRTRERRSIVSQQVVASKVATLTAIASTCL